MIGALRAAKVPVSAAEPMRTGGGTGGTRPVAAPETLRRQK